MLNKRKIGEDYETKVCEALKDRGVIILKRNYRIKTGEIDIIAKDGDCICFIEVKYRSNNEFGNAIEAVDASKQKTIRVVASHYLMEHGIAEWQECRFDVVTIQDGHMKWLKNAFEG